MVWVLNLDAELELETIGNYTRSEHMGRVVAAQQGQLIGSLVGPRDTVLTQENLARHVREGLLVGLPGRAWCPTPTALVMLRAVGSVPEATAPLDVLRTINARPFGLQVREEVIGDSFVKHLVQTLDEALRQIAQPLVMGWLLRRSYGAAGRGRRKIAAGKPGTADLSWIEASLKTGPLTVEPWVEVVKEFTRSGWVSNDGRVTIAPPCLQETTANGAWIKSEEAPAQAIPRHLDDPLQDAFERAGKAIARAGYFGPYGVDGYLHRNEDGRLALNPLSEINGRYTMDWALVEAPAIPR